MSRACCGEPVGEAIAPAPAAATTGDRLALATSPTFIAMALLCAIAESDPAMVLCSGAGAWPLTGMATMYLLMSAFHAGPWLAIVSGLLPLTGKPWPSRR